MQRAATFAESTKQVSPKQINQKLSPTVQNIVSERKDRDKLHQTATSSVRRVLSELDTAVE